MTKAKDMRRLCYYTREPVDSTYYDARLAFSMHLAIEGDEGFIPLNHNSGVLFALATENPDGSLNPKCLKEPCVFEMDGGGFGICAIRTDGEGGEDPESVGCIMLFTSKDLASYKELGLARLSENPIEKAVCGYDGRKGCYVVKWREKGGKWFASMLPEFSPCDVSGTEEGIDFKEPEDACGTGTISVSDDVADRLIKKLAVPVHVDTLIDKDIRVSGRDGLSDIRAKAVYSDGTTALKRIDWDVSGIDFNTPGEYEVRGRIHQDHFEFPIDYDRADPCVTRWDGRYYFIATNDADGNHSLYVREAASIPELLNAEERLILDSETYDYAKGLLWAPEFHEIGGRLYIFLALTPGGFFYEESHVMQLRENGCPSRREDWSPPKRVVKKDGTDICEAGKEITLDMTCFEWQGEYYAVWSQRQFLPKDLGAWLYIAKLNPERPWELLTDPVILSKPDYGWANNHTFVDEGPFALPRGDTLILTFSSAAVDTSYVVGMLTIKAGKDLLVRDNWEKCNYPILTSRSVPGEFGPGHNAYVTDEYGDIWNTYHARPGTDGARSSGIRRVHFDIDGLPVLDMTEDKDVSPEHAEVVCKVTVHNN